MTRNDHRVNGRRTATICAMGAALTLAAGTIVGCADGHGKYTQGHLDTAKQRRSEMMAARDYDMARQAFLAGELDKANKSIDQSLASSPEVPKSHVLKGRILLEKSDLEGAVTALTEAEKLDATNVEAQYYLGIVYERFTQKDKALERYLRAAELEPANPQYAVAAAEMMSDLGRLEEAQKFLLSRTASFEHNAGVRQTLAHIAMMRGEPQKAVELFNEARLLASDDMGVLEDLVRAQIATGRYAEAEYNITKLLKVPENEGRRDLKHMRARCLANVDRPVEAREMLLELTRDNAGAKDIEAWIELGNVACLLKDGNNLRLAASRVIALAPARWEGYTLRALWHLRGNQFTQALESLDKAVERRGASAEPFQLRGVVLEQLGRADEARAMYMAALKAEPKNKTVAQLLATLDKRRMVAAGPQ